MQTPLFIRTLQGQQDSKVPFWFMRQAGRYLPEYRQMRQHYEHFLEFCYTPDAATEVTLQPLQRFGMDAAILFSDILVIPDALGQKVAFIKGEGPKLEAITQPQQLQALSASRVQAHLQPVFTAIKQIKSALAPDKALIGFSGAPWTLACYMLEGQGSREFAQARSFALTQQQAFAQLMQLLEEAISEYTIAQIEAGVDAIQLFDSWAGIVPATYFNAYVTQPTRRIVARIKARYPQIPIIGFAKGAAANLQYYAQHSGVDALGIDQMISLHDAKQQRSGKVLQGNLDNLTLASHKELAIEQTKQILHSWQDIPFVFNLGHGVLPHTPIDHVEAVVQTIREFTRP